MKKNLYRLGMVLAMSAGFALAQSSAAPTTTPKTFPDQQSSSAQQSQAPSSATQPQSSDVPSATNPAASSDQKSTAPDAGSSQATSPTSSSSSNSSAMPQSDQSTPSASSSQSSTPSASSSSSTSTDQSATTPSSSSSATQSSDQKSDQKATEPSAGSQAGAANSTSALPQSDAGGSDLQGKIQSALSQNNLSGVTVNASGDTVELNGTVSSKKERKEAMRIAKESANGKKVVDHIQVSSSASAGATTK